MRFRFRGLLLLLFCSAVPVSGSTDCLRDLALVQVGGRSFLPHGSQRLVEAASVEEACDGCHDGSIAPPVEVNSLRTAESRRSAAASLRGVHPVEVFYPTTRSDFAPLESLDPRLVLSGSRITCLTCHSLPGTRTSIPNCGSRLCLSCHRK